MGDLLVILGSEHHTSEMVGAVAKTSDSSVLHGVTFAQSNWRQ